MSEGCRILVADDHPLMRGALALTAGKALPGAQVLEAESLARTLDLLAEHRNGNPIDLLLLDLKMPGMNGFAGLLTLRADFPDLPVIVVSASEDVATVNSALSFGAAGFVPKSAPEDDIAEAIRIVLDGGEYLPLQAPGREDGDQELRQRVTSLTPQQLKVLLYIAAGKLNKQIAYEMSITEATVKAHITVILRKLKVSSRTQAALAAKRLDLQG